MGVAFSLPLPLANLEAGVEVVLVEAVVGRGAKAGMPRTVGEREREACRRLGRAGSATATAAAGVMGFDGPGTSLSESESDDDDEEDEEDEEEDDEDDAATGDLRYLIFSYQADNPHSSRSNSHDAAFLTGITLETDCTGLTGSSSLELSLLELDVSPALLFFLRLFLGFLLRVLVFATAGAEVDAAGRTVADILSSKNDAIECESFDSI